MLDPFLVSIEDGSFTLVFYKLGRSPDKTEPVVSSVYCCGGRIVPLVKHEGIVQGSLTPPVLVW